MISSKGQRTPGSGAPKQRTPERQAKIVEMVSAGLPASKAALANGLEPSNLARWRKSYPTFDRALKQAEALAEAAAISAVRSGKPGWQGQAWFLERVKGYFPRQELTGKDGGPIKSSTITKETLSKLAQLPVPERLAPSKIIDLPHSGTEG